MESFVRSIKSQSSLPYKFTPTDTNIMPLTLFGSSLTCAPPSQPPLLPLPSIYSSWPMPRTSTKQTGANGRHAQPRNKKPRHTTPSPTKPTASAPILVAPKRVDPKKRPVAVEEGEQEEEFFTGSLYSVSPPPSSLPMPTFLLIAGRSAAASCAVEVANHSDGGAGGVDVSATDELRRLLRL